MCCLQSISLILCNFRHARQLHKQTFFHYILFACLITTSLINFATTNNYLHTFQSYLHYHYFLLLFILFVGSYDHLVCFYLFDFVNVYLCVYLVRANFYKLIVNNGCGPSLNWPTSVKECFIFYFVHCSSVNNNNSIQV